MNFWAEWRFLSWMPVNLGGLGMRRASDQHVPAFQGCLQQTSLLTLYHPANHEGYQPNEKEKQKYADKVAHEHLKAWVHRRNKRPDLVLHLYSSLVCGFSSLEYLPLVSISVHANFKLLANSGWAYLSSTTQKCMKCTSGKLDSTGDHAVSCPAGKPWGKPFCSAQSFPW